MHLMLKTKIICKNCKNLILITALHIFPIYWIIKKDKKSTILRNSINKLKATLVRSDTDPIDVDLLDLAL